MNTPFLLIAEDEPSLQEFYAEAAAKLEIPIIQAVDGIDAEKIALGDKRVACIILDLMLPLRSGEEILQSLQEDEEHVPVIIVSAIAEASDELENLFKGDVRQIVKGEVSIGEIMTAVKKYFATLTEPQNGR